MRLLPNVLRNSAFSLALFGCAALLLAFGEGNVDLVVIRLVIQLPLLLILAALMMLGINLAAAFIGALLNGSLLAATLVALLLAWALAAPPGFLGLGYDALLRPAFAIALVVPWLAGAAGFGAK